MFSPVRMHSARGRSEPEHEADHGATSGSLGDGVASRWLGREVGGLGRSALAPNSARLAPMSIGVATMASGQHP